MFSFLKDSRVYLDWAAAAPVSRKAQHAFRMCEQYGNPGSVHEEGRQAREALERARTTIARLAEVKTDAVIFTGSATEANALGLLGYVQAHEDAHILFAPGAHSSITQNVEILRARGVHTEALMYKNGELDVEALAKQVRDNTVLVAVSGACGETGAITPMRTVRRVLDRVRPGIMLFVDASQLPLVGAYELTRLGADMISLDAQKVGGVRGIGLLIAPRRVSLSPLYGGGGQERGLRSGTPSPALAAALAQALEEAHESREQFLAHAATLRSAFLAIASAMPNLVLNEGTEQAPHILNMSLLGRDTDYLVALLDTAGFAVSTRSSCEVNAEGSRAVRFMTGDPERARTTLRVSWGPTTRAREVRAGARALVAAVKFLDSTAIL